MTPVVYDGPHDEVSLAPVYGGVTFRRGEPVEVPDDLAARLVEQPTFKAVRRKRRSEAAGESQD